MSQGRCRVAFSIAVVAVLLLARTGTAHADTLTLAWDPDIDPSTIGYVVWVGTASNTYSRTVDVAANTTFVLSDAVPGQKYYFRVAAYSAGPTVGTASPEVSGYSNAPPLLAAPGNQTSTVGVSATLQLTGSDPEGAPVWFSAAGLPPGLTINSSTGSISGFPTTAGTYPVTASVSDGVLTTSQVFTWLVNGVTPTPVTLLSPLGTISTTMPDFSWSGVTGAASYLLEVRDSGGQVAIYTTASASSLGCATGGTCRLSPGVVLAAGTATWQVETITSTGATAWSTTGAFTVPQPLDTTAPLVTITTPTSMSAFATTQSSIVVAGTASDNIGVTSVTWVSNSASGIASGTTSWSAAIPLQVGTNNLIVSAHDAAGNASAATLTITYSVPPPTVVIASPSASPTATAANAITVNGSASDVAGIALVTWTSSTGAAGTASGTTAWTAGVPLAPGTNVITVTARDNAGNQSSTSTTVVYSPPTVMQTVDTTPPIVTLTSPTTKSSFNTSDAMITISGTATDDSGSVASVTWSTDQGASGIALGTGTWKAQVPVGGSSTVITITARDAAGNVGTDTVTVHRTSRAKK